MSLMLLILPGEIMGLRRRHVDLDDGIVRVVASLQDVGDRLDFVDPKTDRARRTIEVPPSSVAALRQHRKDQARRRLLLGEAWRDHDLVCERSDGALVHPDVVTRRFARLARRLGIFVRFHDLRHAYATALLAAGVHPKIASEALGHATVAFTIDTYQHVLPMMRGQVATAIEDAMGP